MKEYNKLKEEYNYIEKFIDNNVITILKMLEDENYIVKDIENENENYYKLSIQGILATHIREVHCLVFSKLINNNTLVNLDTKQLVAIFSCFTNIKVQDEIKDNNPKSFDTNDPKLFISTIKFHPDSISIKF